MPNALAKENSPYLQQHANNPVNWVPWNEQAFEDARKDNKLVLVSIGYSACHWCHVMELQSFENEQIAAVMNEHFVCIKVDREERPDVDQIYMDAVQLMTGRGGWPLNCFTTPDGQPIYGGTYYPPQQWISILQQLAQQWRSTPEKVLEYGERLTEAVNAMEEVEKANGSAPYIPDDLHRLYLNWAQSFDLQYGAEDRAPKFPMPTNWRYLLHYGHYYQQADCLTQVHHTLKMMAWGGIYDAVGGGFARYSTDKFWLVPHFEKMLYDNGQLVLLYSEAYRQQPQPLYQQIVEETLIWVEREMTHSSGAFYSALDADSEGEEGKYYVWTKAEIEEVLGADAPLFIVAYNISEEGNWEHGNNIPFRSTEWSNVASQFGLTEEKLLKKLEAAKAQLLAVREKRVRPGLDNKVLTGWNALMMRGHVEAYRAFGNKKHLDAALKNATFIEREMADGDRLSRRWMEGKVAINAFLEDYALLIEAYLALYEVTFDEQWLNRAHAYLHYLDAHFYDEESSMYFYTSDEDPPLIARKKDLYDNVIAAGNSVIAHNLLSLSHYYDKASYRARSAQMLNNMRDKVIKHGSSFANWARLYLRNTWEQYEVVTTGSDCLSSSLRLQQNFLPNALFAGGNEENSGLSLLQGRTGTEETRYFICQDMTCKLPVTTAGAALGQLNVRNV